MTTKLLAVLALALFISACEPNSNETTPTPSPTSQAAATPTATTSAESEHPAPNIAFKAGDKVKVTISGSAVEATIVSVDEKAAKAIVKAAGETKERTVNLSEIVKQ
jgi:nitrous oxide reductase accessory protein NosL